MDADSGVLLYNKGGDEIRYPASITKIMTLLLAVENSSLTEDVVFTETGTRDISQDSGNIGMQVGETKDLELKFPEEYHSEESTVKSVHAI